MVSDAGRRLANSMFKATRGRSAPSLFNMQAMKNKMNGGGPAKKLLPGLDDLIPDIFSQVSPEGDNLTNITRKFG